MPSGIVVQHNHVSADFYGVVRSDLTAIISFLEPKFWIDGKDKGGFVQIKVKNYFSFEQDEHYDSFDLITKNAVKKYFQNGGIELEIFGIVSFFSLSQKRRNPYTHSNKTKIGYIKMDCERT